jgi:tRNA dimethylallyltransferase
LKKLIVITGPTASGKTSLSIELARFYNSEIISADSRQFYRKMNIGTAKPSVTELKTIKHHFIDSLNITDSYNIGKYEEDSLKLIEVLFKNHDVVFLTGGSGLYINAICSGIDDLPESTEEFRIKLTNQLNNRGIESLQQKLKEVDPEYYSQSDINNPHRLIRALEIWMATGRKASELRTNKKKERNFIIKKIGLKVDRSELYNRINQRVDEMIEKGLVQEVEQLLPFRNENALQTVGYKEIFSYLDKKLSLEEAIVLIKQNTRNYAKRQMTWFRKDTEIHWFNPANIEGMKLFIEG